MRYLKTNTATTITVGPFLDKTDGITPETAITVTGVHITFVVDNAGTPTLSIDADATASGGNNDMVHVTNDDAGYYTLELTAAQTNYLGGALLSLNVVGTACPVFHEFTILPANIYDSMIAGTDLFDVSTTQFNGSAVTQSGGRPEVNASHIAGSAVSTSTAQIGVNVVNFGGSAGTFASGVPAVNATQISGDSTAADNLETAFDDTAGPVPWMGIIDQGTAQSASATGLVLRAAAAFDNDTLIGATIAVYGSTQGFWQVRTITDSALSGDSVTVDTWNTTPSGTITYKIFASGPASTSSPPAVNVTQFGGSAITSASGIPEVKVASIATDAITSTTLAASAVTEIQSGLSTLDAAGVRTAVGLASANLDTQLTAIDDYLDTEIAAIKAKTDQLTFTVANKVDANVKSVNDVTVTGTGALGDEWGP